jgi:phosphoribosylanthranilate isomerase
MTAAKICGVSTREAVEASLAGGAAFLGFMFFPASPRNIDPASAAHLARPARGRTRIVAVTVDPDDALLDRLSATLAPDLIQLHGRESPARAGEVARRTGSGVIKVISVGEAADLDGAGAYEGVVDHLMFDAKAPNGAARPGGLGLAFDWSILAGRRFERPWLVAGGLDPWNVAEAARLSGAPIVDVSSGVERGAGLKDPALIAAFLEAVRRA